MEMDVIAVIEPSGGDPRTATKDLLIENLIREPRIGRLAAGLSVSYVCGRTGVTTQSGTSRP